MLVVKVEIWPYGRRDKAAEVGRAYIWNKGGDILHGYYGVAILDDPENALAGAPGMPFGPERHWAYRGEVPNFPRGPHNLWPLIRAALKVCRFRKKKALPLSHGHNGMVKKDVA